MAHKYSCSFCGKQFPRQPQNRHFRQCSAYKAARPDEFPLPCLCGHGSTSLTQMKRHRVKCDVWKNRDASSVRNERRVTYIKKKYGEEFTNSAQIPEVKAKMIATVKERYGADCVLSKESSLYEKVQSYWDGKDRTAHLDKNNFAKPEVKEKIRQYYQKNHGVDNASQVPEIRSKQLKTNLERYGDEQTLRVPSIRLKGIQTLINKYGVDDAAKSLEVQAKIQSTNMERYGVPWTAQDPETRSQMNESFQKFLKSGGNLTYSKSYNLAAIQSTNMERYGAIHPMKNIEYARNHLSHSRRAGPNSLEKRIKELFPQFMFVGDGSYWRYLPFLGQNKNPDFILPGPDSNSPFHGSNKVIEIFGDYWHGEAKTGKPCIEHETETISAWNEVGMKCLVVWEIEFIDESKIVKRISDFLFLNSSIIL